MKRHILSHLGTALIFLLIAMGAVVTMKYPDRVIQVFHGSRPAATYDFKSGHFGPVEHDSSLWEQVKASELVAKNGLPVWVFVMAVILLALLAGKLAASILGRLGRSQEQHGRMVRARLIGDLAGPVSLGLFTFGLGIAMAVLEKGPKLQVWCDKTLMVFYSTAVLWYAYNLIGLIDVGFARLQGRGASKLDAQLVPMIRRILRVVLVLLAVMYLANNVFNQDIKAWLAGLGIAGLALSLAAQDSLKNFFGSITILLDRPFKIGERIVCSGYDGTIEDIGFRSTKIRTGAGHLVSIPNANIVSSPVENIGRRPFIKRTLNVTITYDTPREKIAEGVAILKQILAEEGIREPIHPTIDESHYPPRVFFSDYNPDSLNLTVIYWYAPPAYWEYMEHAERLNLRIFEEFERSGIDMAFPTQTLYLAGDARRKLAVEMIGADLKE